MEGEGMGVNLCAGVPRCQRLLTWVCPHLRVCACTSGSESCSGHRDHVKSAQGQALFVKCLGLLTDRLQSRSCGGLDSGLRTEQEPSRKIMDGASRVLEKLCEFYISDSPARGRPWDSSDISA